MLQSSRVSLQQVIEKTNAAIDAGSAEALGTGLLSIVSVLAEDLGLRKSLADAAVAPEAKRSLLEALFGGRVDAAAVALTGDAASLRWARTQDYVTAVEVAGVTAVAASAQAAGQLGDVEEELFRFARVVESDSQLQWALESPATPEAKRALTDDLLAGRALAQTRQLAAQAAAHPRGLRVSETLDNYGEVLAARQRRSVAEVTVARPLDPAQQERLAQALSRSYGRELVLHVVVDPEVVGGVRVQVGDEIMNGTVSDRLADVRRRLAS